jgi:hypothetical protein
MSAASSSSSEPDPAHAVNAAEIARLNGITIVDMVGSPSQDAYFGMSIPPTTYPKTTLLSESRPRAHYCRLHGWNNTHPGARCNVMGQNPAYTVAMRNATGPDGTGGNPRMGVPVRFSHPQNVCTPLSSVCPPCLPSSPPTHTISPPRRQAIKDSSGAYSNYASRAGAPIKQSAPIMLQAEGKIPQQITFAMLPLPQPLRFPLTLTPLFAFTLTLSLLLPPNLFLHATCLPLLPLLTLALTLVPDNHWRKPHPPKQPLSPLYLGFSLGLCLSSLYLFPLHPFPILPDPLTPKNSSLCAETPPKPPHPNQKQHHLSARLNPRALPTPTRFNALVSPFPHRSHSPVSLRQSFRFAFTSPHFPSSART